MAKQLRQINWSVIKGQSEKHRREKYTEFANRTHSIMPRF